jgi:hypothetical protein
MDDGAGHKVCASICAAIHNAQQRGKHAQLQKIYNNPDTRSLVCCSCDGDHCVRLIASVTQTTILFLHYRFHPTTKLRKVENAMLKNGHDQHKIRDTIKYSNHNVQMLIHGNSMI